jgi:aldehyde:ferredoxin oxidoreductase
MDVNGGRQKRVIIRVNVGNESITREPIPESKKILGGRGFIASILNEEVLPTCDSHGERNKLIITTGLLAGTLICGANRLSIGAKSPLTMGIKECNSGGNLAFMMGRIGVRAIILEGKPDPNKWYILYVSSNCAKLLDGTSLIGDIGINQRAKKLKTLFNKGNIAYSLIGPAGENLLNAASIAISDNDGNPNRFAARGGIGSVQGSKHVIAVVVEASGAEGRGFGRGGEDATKIAQELNKLIMSNPITSEVYPLYGTASVVDITQSLGGLPTRNFSRGRFEHAKNINADKLRQTIIERGGEGTPTHACMPGCIVRCSNIYPDKNGETMVAPLEYETICLLGSNCGMTNLDDIARLNRICNDIGVDTVEIGAALGIMMDQKELDFGDVEKAEYLIQQIRANNKLGRLLGSGAETVGRALAAKRIPTVKGQAMVGYDPRAIKGLGVTYATSPMGADHTAGNTIRVEIDHHSKEGQLEASKAAQKNAAFYDNLGVCLFIAAATAKCKDFWARAVSKVLGTEVTLKDLEQVAEDTLKREKDFNKSAGISLNVLPEWCYEEINPDSQTYFDVDCLDL